MVIKAIYKTLRSIIFSAALFVVGIFVLLYIFFSVPAFTNAVKNRAVEELGNFLGTKVEIQEFRVYPFNEAKINGIKVYDTSGNPCLEVETVAAGINLWKMISEREIILTYGEIIGLKANIMQPEKDAPLNIDFIIKAFAPKNQNQEKKNFELSLRNVVLRKSAVSFKRPWLENKKIGLIDMADLNVQDLAADIYFPKISNSEIEVDLRRLSLSLSDLFFINSLGFKGKFSNKIISLENFNLRLPNSKIFVPEFKIENRENESFANSITNGHQILNITDSYLNPSDFSCLYPQLNDFDFPLALKIQVSGNTEEVNINHFSIDNPQFLTFSVYGQAVNLLDIKNASVEIKDFRFSAEQDLFSKLRVFDNQIPANLKHPLSQFHNLNVSGNLNGDLLANKAKGEVEIESNLFNIAVEGEFKKLYSHNIETQGEINIENLQLHKLFPSSPVGTVNADILVEASLKNGNPEGNANIVLDNFEFKGKRYKGLSINLEKIDEFLQGDLACHNEIADIDAKFEGDLQGPFQNVKLDLDLERLNLSEITDMKKFENYTIAAVINLDAEKNEDDYNAMLKLTRGSFSSPNKDKTLRLKELSIEATSFDSIQSFQLASDWIDANAKGEIDFKNFPIQIKELAASVFPDLIPLSNHDPDISFRSELEFDLSFKKNNSLPDFFNLPVKLLAPMSISGTISGQENSASLVLDLPYLQQGKDKLIYDTKFLADLNGKEGTLNALVETNVPVKRGDLSLNVNLFSQNNTLVTDVHFINTENPDFNGQVVLETDFFKNHFTNSTDIKLEIQPSLMHMGPADWHIDKSDLSYADKIVTINNLRLWNQNQFITVNGKATQDFDDQVLITLKDIDVDYVFDMLQINYVTFGGSATGEIMGRALLSNDPVAETLFLNIKNFSYNGCKLGSCEASGKWNNEEKQIEIGALISEGDARIVKAGGGIWLGKDSLSFNIDANKVPVDFVQPFMAVFSSHVGGFATGDINLFGTFHDIDMTGKIFADSVAIKLDYTNTVYHGSDTVFLYPGKIDIPHFRLYDKYGNSGVMTGELTHRYFHDPSFLFRLSDAQNFLCYDTNSDLNPDWYGTLFGTGSVNVKGEPGITDISADMTLGGNSNFTFVLSDTQYAHDYQFLTFSDRRKEEMEKMRLPTTEDIKTMLKRNMMEEEASISKFGIDIRATVTPQVFFTLIMDPATGDKITARGRGALQVRYESDNEDMMMYGKYEIDEGNYNFSLQDIILRDFKIKEGSYISFNGNPLAADLDISATYRVNTNLSDLDKSFSTDRDLNRTNVPVDAVLSVSGDLTNPDITFDIELPTLTQDVERKVKSIISTDDMMNRQIIYLLALNRFYTPEYMGATGNGGELAAVASSTISSQLSNILGQLTDKFSVSPSFRSDKGDFSDIEVDVALSSKLLNNRLLINGNFGYRDRSNSSTTFVGDFDVEYLLSKNGNLRLKAYNHFNDQNYYLREALTTQGLGIVYRKDFDNWFTFLKKKKKNITEDASEN